MTEYAYQNYVKFNPPVEFTIEFEEEAHKKILKAYGLEEKRIYNINGQDYVWTEEKFDSFVKELNDKGYHPTFTIYDKVKND